MARPFPLTIATPLGRLFEGEAEAVRVTAADGQLGVMAGHAPMVSELVIGEVVVTQPSGEKRYFAATGGVLRVEREGVSIVSERAEPAEGIDVDRARRALQRAQERLTADRGARDTDVVRAELALARALNRLRVARRLESG